ncbi:MAG: UDP-N-acetylmuramate--L-alanine ligase [Elusimicrobiota bacterium]
MSVPSRGQVAVLPIRADTKPCAIHMVGVGGSGMSALALLLRKMDFSVSGSDIKESAVTRRLKAAGVRVFLGHDARHVPAATRMVAYSSAVDLKRNPEIAQARRKGIGLVRRGSLLAQLSHLKRSLTVCGTHGKTTTSSMAGWILDAAGIRPTVVVGGEIRNIRTNTLVGGSDIIVLETDESDGSFLETRPWIAVATNVDNDHLEHYGSMGRLIDAFVSHLSQVAGDGHRVVCRDDKTLMTKVVARLTGLSVTYGLSPGSDCRAVALCKGRDGFTFTISWKGKPVARVVLRVPGMHNVRNALGAAAAAHLAGAPWPKIAKALASYAGIHRRLEVLGRKSGVVFLDDYGHHPTEIAATLSAVRDFYSFKRLLVCFQPHRYSRTKMLAGGFAAAFKGVDFVWVMPIYAASERPIPGISEDTVLRALKRAGIACAAYPGRTHELSKELAPGDCFVTVGAGDVWKVGEDLLRRI